LFSACFTLRNKAELVRLRPAKEVNMIAFLAAVIIAASPVVEDVWPTYEAIEFMAHTDCPLNKRPSEKQRDVASQLVKIEQEEGVPGFARGLLVAAACREASYKIRVRCGDGGASCGLLQLSATRKRFAQLRAMGAKGDDPRSDWKVAARYWLRRVKKMVKLARGQCRGKGGYSSRAEYIWASANKTFTWRYKCKRWGKCRKWQDGECVKRYCSKQAARCSVPPWRWRGKGKHRRQETKHWTLVRDWRKAYTAERTVARSGQ
jgi:hypothetical protein